jgi:hypothetical protein
VREPEPGEWTASVIAVWDDGDTFSAELRRDGTHFVLEADFSMRECGVRVEPGDLLRVGYNRVEKMDPGVWTQEEIDEIMRRARELSRKLRGCARR